MGKSLVTGIDIGHHSIKAVVLKPVNGSYALVGYNELPITEGIFFDNHTLNYQKIVKKLKELRKGLPLFSHKVAVSVPDNAVISKVLQIDSSLDVREKEFAIYQAFSHQSPFPMQELSLDFVKVAEKKTFSGSNRALSSICNPQRSGGLPCFSYAKSGLYTHQYRHASTQFITHLAVSQSNQSVQRLATHGRGLYANNVVYRL